MMSTFNSGDTSKEAPIYPNAIIFDTETTGIPPRANKKNSYVNKMYAPYKEWENRARVVQIAWFITDKDGAVIEKYGEIIKPEEFEIPEESTRIHGISHKQALEKGKSIKDVLSEMFQSIDTHNVTCMVAHNCIFDYHIIAHELYRLNWDKERTKWRNMQSFCTMRKGTPPSQRYMKLSDMYKYYLGEYEDTIRLHDAESDVELCKRLFLYLWKNKV